MPAPAARFVGVLAAVSAVVAFVRASPRAARMDSLVLGDESIMRTKANGRSTDGPCQASLLWGCDASTADRICTRNRHYAEHSGYFRTTTFMDEVDREKETTYYDSVSGKPLFVAPRGRSFDEFAAESKSHGWPSFRDEEVVWENVRVLDGGETVSLVGPTSGTTCRTGGETGTASTWSAWLALSGRDKTRDHRSIQSA